eukprot:GFUD01001747.1.p1 GENE.GFUD01001747.1~~GFUD01001747.1.p1  ORF type:complete len:555 (-),score=143.23 GFUD01001747.1:167-1831(-)
MVEEFSKLSIKNKSTTMSQSMDWIIPQSKLNHHCPFLARDYPYFITEFSILHPTSELEMKWRLELARKEDQVTVNILNVNEKTVFDKKELLNVEVRWNFRLKSAQDEDDGPMGVLMFHQRENMEVNSFQFFQDSQSEGRVVCDLESFDSFAIDGRFVVEVRMELEYFQHDKKKMSFIKQTSRFSASLSELSESIYSRIDFPQKSFSIASDSSCCSAPSLSWLPGPRTQFVSSTLERSKSGYNQTRDQPDQPVHYQYRKTSSSLSDCDYLRRSRSGRLSGASSLSTSTIDRDSRARVLSGKLDETQASEDFEYHSNQTYSYIPDLTYSYISDHVFLAPATPSSCTPPLQYHNNQNIADKVCQPRQGSVPNHPTPRAMYTAAHPASEEVHHHQVLARVPTSCAEQHDQSPRIILKSSSSSHIPGLQAQFYSDSSLSASDSSISSVSSSVISSIYSGSLPDQAVILKDRRRLLEMGVKHDLSSLVRECEKSYLQTLQVSNCLETLLVVDNFLPNSAVKQKIINFMKINLKEVMKESNWDVFVKNCAELVDEIWTEQQ